MKAENTQMSSLLDRLLPQSRWKALGVATLPIAAIAVVSLIVAPTVSIGLLYLFPVLILAIAVDRVTIAAAALACNMLREQFSPEPWGEGLAVRFAVALVAYFGAGVVASETVRRRQSLARIRRLKELIRLRGSAESELENTVTGKRCPRGPNAGPWEREARRRQGR